ncbi:MAG: hypothetical protein AAFS02_01755 [Pseudomonadota bacterium]
MVFRELFPRSVNRQAVFLGAPEAEAEANPNSQMPLGEIYEDFHDLGRHLSSEKFIVIARKGSGKSAFGEFVVGESQVQPNLFAGFVRGSDCHLERLVQLGKNTDSHMAPETLFTWLVLTNILKLITQNQLLQGQKHYNLLMEFLRKNSGYIEINEYQLNELVSKQGWEVNIEQFRRFARGKFGRDLQIRSGRAPFYKLIPHLEDTIVDILSGADERDNRNNYVLFFDDLDVGFDAESETSRESLISLIRSCRRINNEVFGKRGLSAKAIIFLRDDIESHLTGMYADSAKVFASYGVKVSWFQDAYLGAEENDLYIKRFINRRISYAFRKAMLDCNDDDPWVSLVDYRENDKSTFKFVLNNTLFRPRDLLLFFKPLENGAFSLPLDRSQIQSLTNQYVEELSKEIKNEMSSFYSASQVEMIFNAVGQMSRERYSSFDRAIESIERHCSGLDPEKTLRYLFDRSIIGNVDSRGWFTFKCRQPVNSPNPTRLDPDQQVVVQYGISNYLQRHGYT